MVRIGLIGCGRSVQHAHAPALQAMGDRLRVAAIADRDAAALEHVGVLLGVPPAHRYPDYRDMLLQEELEAADIALPHAFHFEAARACLLSGLHLITERPLALTIHDAEELLRLAEYHGKLITVLHYLLYYPPFREGIRLLREGAIGEPFFIRCEGVTGGYGAGTEAYHPAWHDDANIAGGGVWIDSGYHGAYLCAAMMEAPVTSLSAFIGTQSGELTVDDTAIALLSHRNGGVSSIQTAWSVPAGGRRVFEVYGREGTISFDHEGHLLAIFSNATRTWHHPPIMVAQDASFIGIFGAITDCLRHGAPPPVTHRDALHALDIITTGYRAAERNMVESVEVG